jgi:hypothetical protein
MSEYDLEHDYGYEHVCAGCREKAVRDVREAKRAWYGEDATE